MATAVIYARFSCSKQREASIEDQLRVCREWCAREGHEVVAEYCDRAASGRTDERAQFQTMIAHAGESELVVVYMMDRFSRDVYDAPIYKRRLRDHGVRVVSATETVPDGPEAILIESIYEAMAAMESAHTSQRTRRGMEGNALKCMHNGARVFGYRFGEDGRYEVDEAQAEVVREVFLRHIAGEPSNSIAADLARRGWQTTRGTRMSPHAVDIMLKNEKYRGVYRWGDVRVEGGVPAIVDAEVWTMAQNAAVKKARKLEDWGDYALAGRAVCLECGMNLVGVSGYGKSGRRYSYYRCSQRCGCKPIRADWLEGALVDALRAAFADRATALEAARCVSAAFTDAEAEARLSEARRNLGEAERGIANIMRAIEAGMPWDDAAERMGELKAMRAKAEADAAAWGSLAHVDPEDLADFLQQVAVLDDRAVLDALVWQVCVGADEVVAVLNYDVRKDEPARLSMPRRFVQNSFGSPDARYYELLGGRVGISFSRGLVAVRMRRAA